MRILLTSPNGVSCQSWSQYFQMYRRTNVGSKFARSWGPLLVAGMHKIQPQSADHFAADPDNLI